MITFLTEEVRTQYHLLGLDLQREIQLLADHLLGENKSITILFADATYSEVSIRIDE